jgi:4-hydroxy-4-methyl-2-oxoglutarate aldolase
MADLLMASLVLAGKLSSASLHEAAGKIGALPAALKPIDASMHVVGPAFPVTSPPGDNLWLHRAIYAASPADVLVVDVGDGLEYGYWGEVMTVAAQARGIAGLVITGGVRDARQLAARSFPTFAATICIRGTGKDVNGHGQIGGTVYIGDVTVHRGDLVVGDGDGVVVVPAGDTAAAVEEAHRRDRAEQRIFSRLDAGESTIDIYGLPQGDPS